MQLALNSMSVTNRLTMSQEKKITTINFATATEQTSTIVHYLLFVSSNNTARREALQRECGNTSHN